ncbi:MAG: hypothetical protein R3197_15050 [Paracoccaceae bacterium]|nr:hypothetical protein [Paracoccaceae bacterium]
MFTRQKTFLKFTCTSSLLTLAAACAQPQPVPIVADMYFDKYSAAQSANNGVAFCDLKVEDFTPELVAQIRSNPNYERNLAIWLEECPELALAFADFGTASVASPSPSGFGGEADFGGFGGNIGNGPGTPAGGTPGGAPGGAPGGQAPGAEGPGDGAPGGDTGGGDTGGGDTGGDKGDGETGGDTGGDKGDGETGGDTGGDKGDGETGGDTGGDKGDGDTGGGDDGCACGPEASLSSNLFA